MKLNVEGAELKVFWGSTRILSAFGAALIFEFDPRLLATYGFHPTAVLSFLNAMGYRLFLPRTKADGLVLTPFQFPRRADIHVNLLALKHDDVRR